MDVLLIWEKVSGSIIYDFQSDYNQSNACALPW